MTEWSQELTQRIGEAVKQRRGERTALWLSDETAKRGMRVSRSSISELENGKRRSISVAEWLILADALEVPPALLLYPDYPDGTVQILPDSHTTYSYRAVEWLSGNAYHVYSEELKATILSRSPYPPVAWLQAREEVFDFYSSLYKRGEAANAKEIIERSKEERRFWNEKLNAAGYQVDFRENPSDDQG